MTNLFEFYGHGKLLLTGEYFVLDSALALAVPTRFGQHFHVFEIENQQQEILIWKSFDHGGKVWFEGLYFLMNGRYVLDSTMNVEQGKRVESLLNIGMELSGKDLSDQSLEIRTQLEFPGDWGLGSSSTLVAGLAKWFEIDPFELLKQTFGGSGYDIACANSAAPILYRNANHIQPQSLTYDFTDHIHFVHLGKKQNSREGIQHYRSLALDQKADLIQQIDQLTMRMVESQNIQAFRNVMDEHEALVSSALDLPKVKDLYFKGFDGSVKSLGAWGGDYVMAVSDLPANQVTSYFREKGFATIFSWDELILVNG